MLKKLMFAVVPVLMLAGTTFADDAALTIDASTIVDTAITSPTEPALPFDGIKFEDLQLESTTPTAAGMADFFRNS